MSALLEIEGVTAGYTSDIDILQSVSMEVRAGEIRGLIGLNGAGKSTVMKTVAGFLKPKAGRIRFKGDDISGIDPHQLARRRIYMIPQESSLFPYMSVRDNLMLPLEQLRRLRPERPISTADRMREAYALFPILREKEKDSASSLSGGQQKQLEFAKAFALQPELCLIDEPSIGLSPIVAEQVFEWIELFAKQDMAILLVDHNIRRILSLSDYIYVLSLGAVSAEGTRSDFQGDMIEQVRGWMGLS
ncbi:ABC transporter ATP-binding protein [Pikeienuella sp. HZG-20]|uniref:ABC transporter ATP-binding protein n=1 Tax=Paludibacillus litoralis TaxID=3133267 RepID=UPI0030EB2077